jgi:hypothetical protein
MHAERPDVSRERSSFALIGERYLDTQHDASHILELEAELTRRGIVGLRRALYEYVAAGSLWWNFLWQDWAGLDGRDVRNGWLTNVVVFGGLALAAWIIFGPAAAVLSVLVLHGLTVWIGLTARAGSLPSSGNDDDKEA